MRNYAEFENQEIVWSPSGNESVENFFKTGDLGFIDWVSAEKRGVTTEQPNYIIMEGKSETEDGPANLITREHFEEMIEFEKFVMNISIPVPPGNETADIAAGEPPTRVTFYDLCKKVNITDEAEEK